MIHPKKNQGLRFLGLGSVNDWSELQNESGRTRDVKMRSLNIYIYIYYIIYIIYERCP